MLIFSLRYPRNKFQTTFLSALVCPDTRLQPPNPPTSNQLAITTALCGLMGWRSKTWQINPKKYISTRCDKTVFPNKNHFTKAGKFRYKKCWNHTKTKAFLPFHQSNELSKNTGILTNRFFGAVLSRTIPSLFGHLYGCLMIWPPSLYHVAWPHFTH